MEKGKKKKRKKKRKKKETPQGKGLSRGKLQGGLDAQIEGFPVVTATFAS